MKIYLVVLVIIISMFGSTVSASAAPDSAVVIVNPVSNSTIYSNNLLISVKVTEPKTIKVQVFEEKQSVNGTLSAVNVSNSISSINKTSLTPLSVMVPASFTCTNNLSFYTKQLNNLKQGLYRIQVDTINESGNAIYSNNCYVMVKDKEPESNNKIFETPQSGTLQFFQNVLKTIFGK